MRWGEGIEVVEVCCYQHSQTASSHEDMVGAKLFERGNYLDLV